MCLEEASACVCVCVCVYIQECVFPWTLCVCVCYESFSPAGGALMATRRRFAATQPPTICLPPGRYYVCSGAHSCLCEHTLISTQYIQACPSAGVCLPPTWLSPSITPHSAPRPPLSRKTPAVKVLAQPASPLCCFKASHCSLDTNTLHCFLIICLHHRMHFYSTEILWLWMYHQSCPQGTSECCDPPTLELSAKSTYVLHLWNFRLKSRSRYHWCNHNQCVPLSECGCCRLWCHTTEWSLPYSTINNC